MQCDSVVEALLDQEIIPLDTITLTSVNEGNIGSLIFYYELLTSLVGELIDVDTYDQPGVEAGKIILKKKLQAREDGGLSYELHAKLSEVPRIGYNHVMISDRKDFM